MINYYSADLCGLSVIKECDIKTNFVSDGIIFEFYQTLSFKKNCGLHRSAMQPVIFR